MEYEIVWTEPASEELEAIRAYLDDHNPSAARRVLDEIMARVEQLQTFPRIGGVYRSSGKSPIRKIVSGKYRIFYRVLEVEKRVEILLVWHGARQDPDLP
jgi:toxin ParE1/3/4